MKRTLCAIAVCALTLHGIPQANAVDTIPIVKTSDAALTVEATAAAELGKFLKLVYPDMEFPVETQVPAKGNYILLGTRESVPAIGALVTASEATAPGSFVVMHVKQDGRAVGVICGQDSKAVMDGVYRFLEAKLGVAFYFNEAVFENKVTGPFNWQLWNHSDKPLFPYRGMNPFHAFYGSPTTMNFEEWKDYLARIARTGINWLNIHTYEHYGVRQFEFRGVKNFAQDPTSTRYGGEWSTRNVWDMRQMPTGGNYYDFPIHGSDSVRGRNLEERVDLEKKMYEQFIRYALEQYGIKTYETLDFDNYGPGAIDQKQIMTLPESDRILVKEKAKSWPGGDRWWPNVDTAGGYEFVKAQVKQILDDRPSLAGLAVQWRGQINPGCLSISLKEMPASWKKELAAVYKNHPELNANWPLRFYYFTHCKTAAAVSRALDELGRSDMKRGFGWWSSTEADGVEAVRQADAFCDPRLDFLPLNHIQQGIEYVAADYRQAIAAMSCDVMPVPYLQEDVRHIIGGTGVWDIEDGLSAKAQEMKLDGTFMSHFATRPTDLKQKYWVNNLWEATREESRKSAEERFASDWFGGTKTTPEMVAYSRALSALEGFGELCCNGFYDWGAYPLRFNDVKDHQNEIIRYEGAIKLGTRIDRTALSELARARLDYYQGYLRFAKTMLEHSYALHYRDRDELPKDPFEVAKLFVSALEAVPNDAYSRIHAIDKGQLAEIYGRFIRQVLWRYKIEGLYPYYGGKFAPIGNRDKGFYVDPAGIARPVIQADNPKAGTRGFVHPDLKRIPANREESVVDSYMEVDATPFVYEADGELNDKNIMPKGRYQVEVFFPAWIVKGSGERIVRLSVEGNAPQEVDLFADGKMAKVVTFNDVMVTDGALTVTIEAVQGKVAISGVFATLQERLHPQDPPQQPRASWKFDFGPADAPVAEGYTPVSNQTDYRGDALGYGWREAVGMLATQRPGKDALTDDFVESGIYRVFQADVPNGAYRVQLRMGDPKAPVKTCNIIIEGKLRAANLGMKTGEIITKTFDVRVDDGRLDIGFSSFGQWATRWCVNAIEIEPTKKGAADRTEAIKVESKQNDTPVVAEKTDCGCGL